MPMKFHAEEEKELLTGLKNRLVSDCGRVEIGAYPVIYGWRVRAGFVGSPCVVLDWCAGSKAEDLQYLFATAIYILSHREYGPDCFDGIPQSSNVKPYYNDKAFIQKLTDLLSFVTPCHKMNTTPPLADDCPEFLFIEINPRRKARGVEAARVEADGQWVWMSKRDIEWNIRDFGPHPELLKAMESYK